MELSKARVEQLVARHCPVLHLHPGEASWPSSVEDFLAHSELWLRQSSAQAGLQVPQLIVPLGKVDEVSLLKAQSRLNGGTLFLKLEPSARDGCRQADLKDVPLYVLFKQLHRADGTVAAHEIVYATFYAFNGPYQIGLFPPLRFEAGAHDGDWEHFTVRLDPGTGDLLGCMYHAHRPIDGQWLPAAQAPVSADGRPVAYVARGAHGLYCTPGIHRRALLFANDHCSAKGPIWRPNRCVMMGPVLCCASRGTCLPRLAREARQQSWLRRLQHQLALPQHPSSRSRELSAADEGSRDPASAEALIGVHSTGSTARQPASGPQVLWAASPGWPQFAGAWGSSAAPMQQTWCQAAEYPQSRTWLQRVIHFWPENLHDLVD